MNKIIVIFLILSNTLLFSQTRESILEFNCKDSLGNTVNITDFEGKVVYLDVWASWCYPCRRQIPKLKVLKEEYKDAKDLVFLYVSIDSDFNKWKKFVAKKEVHGVHLIANEFFNGEFSTKYGIYAIPHFILIDKKGNVYKNDAPRPGWPDLITDLDLLLKE